LRNTHQEIDFDYLSWCYGKYKASKVSISGGGDPLYNIGENYNILSQIIKSSPYSVDLHTNENLLDKLSFLKSLAPNQIVVTTNEISEIRILELERLLEFTKVRAVLIYLNQSLEFIQKWSQIYSFVPRLTIRECWGMKTNFNDIKILLQPKFPKIRFLEDGDYNYYFMPDNTVYDDYQATKISKIFRRDV
jgi:hypothetical protein